uniref:p26 protein n=1 Tax=Helicoverpa armigera nucleopolyhedrovirus TaxID=51313 RepID=A0A0E3JAP6_9ABAC|nr:p26 protein [Helicoverpa armigera nucleopolyhedrovirus]
MLRQTCLFFAILASAIGAKSLQRYNVEYTIDNDLNRIFIHKVDNRTVSINVIGHQSNDSDTLDRLHHFPGVATSVMFPRIDMTSALFVLLKNGAMARVVPKFVYTNYHVHKHRLVYSQLATFALEDRTVADLVLIGAPIFRNKKLVSVVTHRHDDRDRDAVMFPVTGVRPRNLVSGQIQFDSNNGVTPERLLTGRSVYGRRQMSYLPNERSVGIKEFALTSVANRATFRNLTRNVHIFYNDDEIVITLSEGEFEISRIRFDGPLLYK